METETKLSNLTSIAAFAQYVHEHHCGNEYTEYEGIVFSSVEIAYMICSHTCHRDEWKALAKLSEDELRQKIAHNCPSLRDGASNIMEKILLDKIFGCKELRKEFLSEHENAYAGEFGHHLQAIYQKIKKMDGLRK